MTSRETSRVGSSHKKRFKTPMSMTALESPTMENLEKRFPPLLSLAFASLISPPAPVRSIHATCASLFPNRASGRTRGHCVPSVPSDRRSRQSFGRRRRGPHQNQDRREALSRLRPPPPWLPPSWRRSRAARRRELRSSLSPTSPWSKGKGKRRRRRTRPRAPPPAAPP